MNKEIRIAFTAALLMSNGLVAPGALADVLYLTSGGTIEGRIVRQTEQEVEIDVGAGTMTLPMLSVVNIERGRTVLDDYDDRAAALAPDDVDGWLALARWSSEQGLEAQARKAYQQVVSIDADNPEARQALGLAEAGSTSED